ncbi:MAG: calcium-binding EGF-like domain-containing protein [Chitinophagaceae bacterium]|nr:calcium-binding EGF-like domain-containing protein [Chitinophagaceae bacterium]
MKQIRIVTTLAVLMIFGAAMYMSSCKPNACITRAVECKNGGTCRDGDCICASGYEGDSCQFTVNKKFDSYYACIRTRLINETTIEDNDDTLRVKPLSTDKFGIRIYSIRDSVYEVLSAKVNGNYITIPEQTFFWADTLKYYGSGSLNNGVLTLTVYSEKLDPFSNWNAKTTYVGYKFD